MSTVRLLLPALGALLLGPNASPQELLSVRSSAHVPRIAEPLEAPRVHDFDSDGLPDLVDARVVLKNFGGVFAEIREPFTSHEVPLAFADFDGDGQEDVLDLRRDRLETVGISLVRTPFATRRIEFSFLPSRSFAQAAVADFDGDGDPDVILEDTGFATGLFQIENLGAGNFRDASASRMPMGSRFVGANSRMIPSDFDGDGDIDLLMNSSLTAGLEVLENQGGGVFSTPDPTPFGGLPAGSILDAADVDGDGDLDLWIDGARLVLNVGGRFELATVQPLPIRRLATRVISADIDRDGDLDAWLEAEGAVLCGWFENVGPGQAFVDRTDRTPLLRREATTVAVTDFDGDGWLDVVAFDGTVQIHRGQPRGRFVDISREPQQGLAYGDVDGDSLLDTFLWIPPFTLMVRLNDGVGGVVEQDSGLIGGDVFDLADLDGDGDLDLLYLPSGPFFGGIQVALNDGNARFTAIPFPTTANNHAGSRFGDVDGDGDLDLILTGNNGGRPATPQLFLNDGAGNLTPARGWQNPNLPQLEEQFDLADADGDGDLDILCCGSNELRLLTNDGQGNFQEAVGAFPPRFPNTGLRPVEVRVGDVDGDGDTDAVALYLIGAVNRAPRENAAVFLNDGSGTFTLGQVLADGIPWRTVAFGDVEDDGDLDLLVGRDFEPGVGPRVRVFANDSFGNYRLSSLQASGERFLRTSILQDLDGDGDLDLRRDSSLNDLVINRTIDLRLLFVPRVGGDLVLEIGTGIFQGGRRVTAVLSPAKLATPVPIPGIGVLTVDPAAGIALSGAPSTTPGQLSLPIPNDPRLAGLDLFAQALVGSGPSARLTAAITIPLTL